MNQKKTYSIIAITAVLLTAIGVTFAYFAASVGTGVTTPINVESKTTDKLTFTSGSPVSLIATQDNFGESMGNLSGETTSSATLIANSNTNTASETYNVYFNISENNYEYTTLAKTAELILTITDPSGAILNTLPGLNYVTVGSVSGFDITEYSGLINVSENHVITTTSSTTGLTEEWKTQITFINLDSDQVKNQGKTFSGQLKLQKEDIVLPTFAENILNNNGGISAIAAKETPNFATLAETNEGMFATTDDYGTSYYFRGAVDNNWVKFNDMYWRIVRINGDNTVKLIYSGTTAPNETQKAVMTGSGTQISTSVFNSTRNSAEYVGYKYTLGEQRGLGTSSDIKTYLETWYANNLAGQDAKIADTIFCNDRSVFSGTGIGVIETYFGAYNRLRTKKTPSLLCPHKDDTFTKNDTTRGNGQLSEKVGLLTADEASMAGLSPGQSTSSNYLYTNSTYWLGSPSNFYSPRASGFYVYLSGLLDNPSVDSSYGVRAVVSLSSDIVSTGSGEWNNPYIIK